MPTSRQPTNCSPPATHPRYCPSPASANVRCSPVRSIARRANSIGLTRMVREMVGWRSWALMLAMLVAFVGQVRAEDDVLQRVYAGVQERIHAEFEYNLAGVTRQLLRSGAP